MDAVISAFQKPAIMVIDTWWSRTRMSGDDDTYIEKAILERLDRAYAAGIPVVVAAGIGLPTQSEGGLLRLSCTACHFTSSCPTAI